MYRRHHKADPHCIFQRQYEFIRSSIYCWRNHCGLWTASNFLRPSRTLTISNITRPFYRFRILVLGNVGHTFHEQCECSSSVLFTGRMRQIIAHQQSLWTPSCGQLLGSIPAKCLMTNVLYVLSRKYRTRVLGRPGLMMSSVMTVTTASSCMTLKVFYLAKRKSLLKYKTSSLREPVILRIFGTGSMLSG